MYAFEDGTPKHNKCRSLPTRLSIYIYDAGLHASSHTYVKVDIRQPLTELGPGWLACYTGIRAYAYCQKTVVRHK